MARIRTIKPEFFRHHDLYICERDTGLPLRVAFAGLWTVADREGRFKWRPHELKLDCLPFDDVDFSRVLDALATRGFVVKYATNGKEFGIIPSFTDHQVINNRESPSALPDPKNCEIIQGDIDASTTRAPRVNHACPTPLVQDQGEGEGKGKGIGRDKNQSTDVDCQKKVSRASAVPGSFEPDETGLHAASAAGIANVRGEVQAFVDFHRSKGNTFKDHQAAWRTWCRNWAKFSGQARGPTPQQRNGRGQEAVEFLLGD